MINVIIPVYNSEKTLSRCLDSVIMQSNSEWRAIVIDDGSTDSSLIIAQTYENRDNRITVYSQCNKGAGPARNLGIQKIESHGYIVFLDSDDYLEFDYFELLSKHSEDIVYINVNRRDSSGKIVTVEKLSRYNSSSKNDLLRCQMTGKMLWGGVRKAVNTELIRDNSIMFSSTRIGEEAVYSFLVGYFAKSYSFIKTPVYNYQVHEGSLSQSQNDDPWGDVVDEIRKCLKNMGIYDVYADTVNAFEITAMTVAIWKMGKRLPYLDFVHKVNNRINESMSAIDKTFKLDLKHMSSKAKVVYFLVKFRLYPLVYIVAKLK